jgi:BirA family transcriptional regulator, biotin operon repressor / biotin---[acetyl-CoA-carboxylase] ligase
LYKIPANTVFIGKKLVFVPECHSTNTLAHEMSQLPSTLDGTVVITNHQFAGRGQRGNTWEAEPGKNLTFSVILKPVFLNVKDQFSLNIISSLAIYDLLSNKTDGQVSIKWPNDILIDGKKVCGILIENQILGQQVSQTIVGIGLNVNQSPFGVPTATSVSLVTGKMHELQDMLDLILSHLESRFLQLRSGKLAELKAEYLNRMFLIDQPWRFKSGDTIFEGTIKGINDLGQLLIEDAESTKSYGLKEIVYVR